MEDKKQLSDYTKTLLGMSLREWRIELLYADRGDSTCSHKRVVAHNENEASLILLLDHTGEEELDREYENSLISEIWENLEEIITISKKFNGIPAPTEKCPGIYAIDPFDGELTLITEYPDGFIPKFFDGDNEERVEAEDDEDEGEQG